MNKKEMQVMENMVFNKYMAFTINTDITKEIEYKSIIEVVEKLEIKLSEELINKILKYNVHDEIVDYLADKFEIANFRIQDLMFRNREKLIADIKHNRVNEIDLYTINDILHKYIIIDQFTYEFNKNWLIEII